MRDRDIIEQIVREVIEQLSVKEETSKPTLLVIGDTSFIEPKLLSMMNENWNTIRDETHEDLELAKIDKVLFLHATQDLLAKGALGLFDTPESKLLSRCLVEAIPVSIVPTVYLQDYILEANHPKNSAYVSQIIGYKDSLLKFGVKLESFEKAIFKKNDPVSAAKGNFSTVVKKKLLTERDIKDAQEEQIVVDRSTIITPLAHDTARQLGKIIKVIESKGANA